ncbi:MAG: diadenylate cyclase [Bryobacteraceae bacterium]
MHFRVARYAILVLVSFFFLRWQSVVDFAVLAVAFYFLLLWARQTRALRLALAIVSLHGLSLVARQFELVITGWVLEGVSIGGIALLLILFQGEIRHALLHLDDVLRLGLVPRSKPQIFQPLAEAAFYMAARRVGALMVLPRRNSIQEMLKGGLYYGAEVSKPVIESVFEKNSPLHDGAAIIEGKLITRVGVVLPLTEREDVPDEYGTRHRAAMGLAEHSDALVIVVSEERGVVSLANGRDLRTIDNPQQLVNSLIQAQSVQRYSLSTRLKQLLVTNLNYRLAAAGLAAFLWGASMLSTRTTVRTVSVPVEFRNVPRGMELYDPSASRVDVQLRASPWLMDSLSPSSIVARFDMTGAQEGAHQLHVSSQTLNIPPSVIVEHVYPDFVTVRVAKRVQARPAS